MKFVIIGKDGPEGVEKRLLHRETHLARLADKDQEGKVILAGPLTDKSGSLIVLEADSLEEAQAFADQDPYTTFGVFQEVTVHPFRQVFPASPHTQTT